MAGASIPVRLFAAPRSAASVSDGGGVYLGGILGRIPRNVQLAGMPEEVHHPVVTTRCPNQHRQSVRTVSGSNELQLWNIQLWPGMTNIDRCPTVYGSVSLAVSPGHYAGVWSRFSRIGPLLSVLVGPPRVHGRPRIDGFDGLMPVCSGGAADVMPD